eukprot:TRINITY_DN19106_c0_g1_i1.p1 TRINITY_DN19106_c0_g1~~TRINITY_DN19106_c0_g1_i1.p1  ORF type:complete len:294 (+),score=78.28 TRINITY_DN19106_c0_g1_i1:257-1138(+)
MSFVELYQLDNVGGGEPGSSAEIDADPPTSLVVFVHQQSSGINAEYGGATREGVVKKAKDKYTDCVNKAMSVEAGLQAAKQKKNPSEIQKLTQKLQSKLSKEMRQDQEVKEAINAMQDYQSEYVSSLQRFMTSMQQQEEEKIGFIQEQVMVLANALQQSAAKHTESKERLQRASQSADSASDFAEWVSLKKTGSSPPPAPVYRPKTTRRTLIDTDTTEPQAPTQSFVPSQLTSTSQRYVRALFDFVGTDADELDFFVGDKFELIDKDDETGWWVGINLGRTAWFPSTYVVELI